MLDIVRYKEARQCSRGGAIDCYKLSEQFEARIFIFYFTQSIIQAAKKKKKKNLRVLSKLQKHLKVNVSEKNDTHLCPCKESHHREKKQLQHENVITTTKQFDTGFQKTAAELKS